MLKLNSIEVAYLNVIRVLHGISLAVEDCTVVALLGANGAGKTTTLKAISGLLSVEEGEVVDGSIEWDGQRIDNKSAVEIGKLGIVQALEGRRVFGHLTAEENLLVGAHNRREGRAIREDLSMVYDYFPRLKNLRHNIAGYLSGGEQQMLTIGRSLMGNPKLLLVDEPTEGLAPLLVMEVRDMLEGIHKVGVSILLVEHNIKVALSLASRVYLMGKAHIGFSGTPAELEAQPETKSKYLEV